MILACCSSQCRQYVVVADLAFFGSDLVVGLCCFWRYVVVFSAGVVVRRGSRGSVWSWCCGGELFVGVAVDAGGFGDAVVEYRRDMFFKLFWF
ncbi:hypothetical protein P8452_23219 [Trifolium repens]|nr:hypothetical protein P8452_23219 [Trifolium repens]